MGMKRPHTHGRWTKAYAVLADMMKRGLIEQLSDGTYRITDVGRAAAARHSIPSGKIAA